MAWLRNIYLDLKLNIAVANKNIFSTNYGFVAAGLYFTILFILQWLFNIQEFWNILVHTPSLSALEKIDFFANGLLNVFRYFNDIVPISLILISLMQALAITLLIVKSRESSTKSKKSDSIGSLALALVGSGCVACGGSVLTPLLGAIASNISITLAERTADAVLIVAVLLSYRALSKISFKLATVQSGINKS